MNKAYKDYLDRQAVKEQVRESRQKKREEFGEIGLKTDCLHCMLLVTGEQKCDALTKLYCRKEVCMFYET